MDSKPLIDTHRPDLTPYEAVYKDIHQNPELSRQEVRTANIVSTHLKSLGGYNVHEKIGGHGVVGVLKNGPGKCVVLRADMDALPHLENTGLPYASTKKGIDPEGKETPIMHACGHDMHTAVLMATSKLLLDAKASWSGTLVVLFQPSEELASGARAMVADGLWTKLDIPKPDIIIGEHTHAIKTGVIAISPGPILTAVDSLEVRIWGKSGHISRADIAVDPVLTAAHIIVRLQSVVTHEVRPENFAVIACASIHGGSAANIIPDFVDIKLSIRSYLPEVHERLMGAVYRIIKGECVAAECPKEPEFKTIMHAPSTINHKESTETLMKTLKSYFGDKVIDSDPFGASEDFSELATACGAPYVFFNYGCVDEGIWDQAVREGKVGEIPHNHNARFAPVVQPTMRTAVDGFAVAALTFLGKGA